MCRRNMLWGIGMLAFGFGLLASCWMDSEFVKVCIGVGMMAVGVLVIQKK